VVEQEELSNSMSSCALEFSFDIVIENELCLIVSNSSNREGLPHQAPQVVDIDVHRSLPP